MRHHVRRGLGIGLAVALTLGIAALSRVPYSAASDDHGVLRLSWRAPGEVVEECRQLSREEIERQPIHMRREQVCERRLLPYRLRVRLDGTVLLEETVRPSGAREDRPLFVFRQIPLAPGDYRLEVEWERVPGAGDSAVPREDADAPPAAGTAPRRLELAADLRLEAGDIALVTYDLDRQVLVARGRGGAETRNN
jgi:hypothetical protein